MGRARLPIRAGIALAALLVLTVGRAGASPAAGDPVTCAGYPEPRIYLESQSWWEPQPGPATHPGTGMQGHIHVGTCFPLYQHVSGDVLHLDIDVKLHNLPGSPSKIRLAANGDTTWNSGVVVPACPSATCETHYSIDFPLASLHYRGWRELDPYLNVSTTDGHVQRGYAHWSVFFDVPRPDPPADDPYAVVEDVGGDTWYDGVVGGATGKYSAAFIERASIPWDEATGALRPLSGTWSVAARFEASHVFAYVDPALHAMPPSHGVVVLDSVIPHQGYLARTLTIDTTALADGPHRLLVGSGNVGTNGTNTGVIVIPFLVRNTCG